MVDPAPQLALSSIVTLGLVQSGWDLTEPRLSPDGASVAFVQRWGTQAAVVRRDFVGDDGADDVDTSGVDDRASGVDDGADDVDRSGVDDRADDVRRPSCLGPERLASAGVSVAPGRGLGGGAFCWTPTGGLVLAATDGELWLHGSDVRRLTAFERSCRAPATDGDHVAFVVDEAEIWRVDVASGARQRLDDGGDAFCFDPAIDPSTGDVSWLAWSPPDMPWDGARRVVWSADDGRISHVEAQMSGPEDWAVQQPRFTAGGAPVWIDDRSGWLNVVVCRNGVEVRIDDDAEHAGPTWGLGQRSYAVSPDERMVAYSRNERGFGALWVVDVDTGDRRRIGRGVHGGLDWVGSRLCALRSGARTPTSVVVYEFGTTRGAPGEGVGAVAQPARADVAVSGAATWDRIVDRLPEPSLVDATGDDGAVVHARHFGAGHGRLLCWVHGGPTDQWMVDWNPRLVYWWSRGWDVLIVDPRGTTGHGRAYQRAMNGGWGRTDVDDTAALVRRAHELGWAVPATTVAMGSSAGGLTVLGLLADHPGLVAGGVTRYPVSDIAALADGTHRFEAHYNDTLVGPASDTERFAALSPLNRAAHIASPLLLFHGTDDPVVPQAQSDALARAVSGPVEYVVYEGEGHGFRDPEHVADEYERTAAFVDRLLSDAAAGQQG